MYGNTCIELHVALYFISELLVAIARFWERLVTFDVTGTNNLSTKLNVHIFKQTQKSYFLKECSCHFLKPWRMPIILVSMRNEYGVFMTVKI